MAINKNFINKFVKSTQFAAYGASLHIGKKDKNSADKAAVDNMRKELNKIEMNGRIVIGEGELDEAPMLYIGEKVGTGIGDSIDIAVDPVEGTNFVAYDQPNAISVLAAAKKDEILHAPETYMNKIVVGPNLPKNIVDLDNDLEDNLRSLAKEKSKKIEELTACVLDRPRHKEIINKLKSLNVNLKLITDGDVCGALLVVNKVNNIDIFIGIGGGPEGVLAAAALTCFGCQMQTRLLFQNENEIERANKMGITDLDKKYNLEDMIKGDVIFCATGITKGDLISGIKNENEHFSCETFVSHKSSNFFNISSEKILK
tara:strand:+ start:3643 stop:4587 length:945 start_codon:yes stop_codon:yes gene_type:complete